jgi:prevent-host-death family protein
MESMAISKFKATCLAVLERVRRTKKPVLITRFGQPVAEVVPPSAPLPGPRAGLGPWWAPQRSSAILSLRPVKRATGRLAVETAAGQGLKHEDDQDHVLARWRLLPWFPE